MTILNIQFDDIYFLNEVKLGSINFQPLKFLFKNKPSSFLTRKKLIFLAIGIAIFIIII